jgi:hypothetical protein
MLQNDPLRPFHFETDPDPVFHFDVDPDPAFHFDADRIRIQLPKMMRIHGCDSLRMVLWAIFFVLKSPFKYKFVSG